MRHLQRMPGRLGRDPWTQPLPMLMRWLLLRPLAGFNTSAAAAEHVRIAAIRRAAKFVTVRACSCILPDTYGLISRPYSSGHSSPPGLLLSLTIVVDQRSWTTLCIMQANFSSEQSGRGSETEGVRKLKQLCSELTSRPEAVKDLLAALQDEGRGQDIDL